jgi:branched-chain amino acid transport system ATP-binding protein
MMLLELEDVHTYYGTSHVLFGVSLKIEEGRAVALLGRNGAGKTTTLRSIMGLTSPKEGKVRFKGKEITGWPVHSIANMGISYVPEDRQIFPDLTVWENLELGFNPKRKGQFTIENAYEIFPVLEKMRDRPGGMISGGEQQMLAIARSLMSNPDLILLDEPLEGLSPLVVKELGSRIKELRKQGLNLLLSEQNVRFAMDLCDWVYIIDKGAICYQGTVDDLSRNDDILERYMLVSRSVKEEKD